MKKALLIIDMQKGCFTESNPKFEKEQVVKRINILSNNFRKANLPVVFIQHDGSKWGEFVLNTVDWELIDELEVEKSDHRINKYANDSFYKSDLHTCLADMGVNELFITGFATDFCVESTIQSALTKDYKITVIKDGHTVGDRPHMKAEKVIEHYNWIWQNMIPTKGSINVMDSEKVVQTI